MKKTAVFRGLLLSSVALAVAACGNLSKVTDEGTTENPVFPKIAESEFNHDGSQFGSWPNWENVRQIERGMNKDQIYNLIGRPHFEEGLYGVREWDYAFNYREQGVHKICQYKILFDKNMNAQSFFWYPNGCNGNSSFNLSGDFLFDFDKDTLTAKGREVVDNVAQQVKACAGMKGQAEKDCLRPNRRVIISASGNVLTQQEGASVAGPNGPAPLYQTPAYNNGNK